MGEITRLYENMVVIDPTLAEGEMDEFVEKIKSLIDRYGGKIVGVEKWGKRKLAYEIKRHEYGHYYILYFEGSSKTVSDVEHNYNILEPLLRYMIIAIESLPSTVSTESFIENQQGEEETNQCSV